MMVAGCKSERSSQGEDFLGKVNQVAATIVDDSEKLTFFNSPRIPVESRFRLLPTGSTKPSGWLLQLMTEDLETGIVGALDELYPGISKDDLYHTARRGGMDDIPEMGDIILTGDAWEVSIMWWNSETIGNWWDGFVRHAFLTGQEDAMAQSHKIVENLLASQDKDGYIGIYKENLRYKHEGSNGELWAQTTAFRMLLAYYEFTSHKKVLDAVERAMALTMKNYGEEGRNPFYLKNAFGGVTHGLMMTDVCETLHRITGNSVYQDYATYLYRAFSTYSINRAFNDIRYPFLLQRDSLFEGHGAHTYEHLRSLLNAYYHTGYPELKTAYRNAMYKLEFCMLPSGAGHGQEWIAKMVADPTYTHTEFCTMVELRNFFASAVQKTGDVTYADRAEKLTFNGIMGSRDPQGKGITYGKGDNCCVVDSKHHGKEDTHHDPRYKYSPTHSDPAVCCVPNYTRNYSYYVDNMWMKADDGIAAVLYGPSKLTTTLNGSVISIEQTTNYPMSDEVSFKIVTDEPATFALYFRKPGWSEDLDIDAGDAERSEKDGFIRIEKEWRSGDAIRITIVNEVRTVEFRNGDIYYQRGPLVYAYAIPHRVEPIKEYKKEGFFDFHCFPVDEAFEYLSLQNGDINGFTFSGSIPAENPWYKLQPYLTAHLTGKDGNREEAKLVPMGNTVLRQVSFPILNNK